MNSHPVHRWNLEPVEARRCLLKAQVFEALGCPNRAVKEYLQALEHDPDCGEAVLDVAERVLDAGDAARAERLAEAVARHQERAARALGLLAEVWRMQDRDVEATRALRRAVELDPGAAQIGRQLGEVLGDYGKFEEAREILERLLERDPLDPYTQGYLGEVLRQEGRVAEAVEAFSTALWLFPGYSWASRQLAGLLCELERPREAMRTLRRALGAQPRDRRLKECLHLVEQIAGNDLAQSPRPVNGRRDLMA